MIETKLDLQTISSKWFRSLRDQFCDVFQALEDEYAVSNGLTPGNFERKLWDRTEGGGGEISIMRGQLFEKVGVNISTVFGELSPEFRNKIPGTENNPNFFATGISIVAHMTSPHIPAAHFNTRFITTDKIWFGGGADMTPTYPEDGEAQAFHNAFKNACDTHDASYYQKFKANCDEYFYLSHRNEPRGIGGIFYDYLNTDNFDKDFAFTQDVGKAFLSIYPQIIRDKMYMPWSDEEREYQLYKRGRYVEFNLLYDRGTKFGLMTGGNIEAILMSLPPVVKW